MCAMGQERTFAGKARMSALPPKADVGERDWYVPLCEHAELVDSPSLFSSEDFC